MNSGPSAPRPPRPWRRGPEGSAAATWPCPSPAAPGGPKPAGGAAANSCASLLPGFGGRKPPALPPRPKTYAVQPGETLQAIALRFYGTRSAWERIREANKAKITTTGHVKAGDVLILP